LETAIESAVTKKRDSLDPEILGIHLKALSLGKLIRLPQLGLYVPTSSDMSAAITTEIKRYNAVEYLRLLSALMSFRDADYERFVKEMTKEHRDPGEVLRPYQIRYLVRELLLSNASWCSGANPHTRDIVMHCEWAQNSLCQADKNFIGIVPGDAWAVLWRMSYQQFKDLEGNTDLPRSLIIYRKLAVQVAQRHSYSVSERFQEATGIALDLFWFISLALYGWILSNRGRAITSRVLSSSKDLPGLTKEISTKFLNLVSCNRDTFVQATFHPKSGELGYEPYNLNPLIKWPLIRITEDSYIAPSPRDLLERASNGIYYDLIPLNQGRFGAVLGDAFEKYVGLILKGLPGVPQMFPETRYMYGRDEKVTCDWIILDKSTAVLIECKTSAINALAKVTGDRSHIKADLAVKHGIVDGILKILETEQAIRQCYPGLETFKDIQKFFGIVVVLDSFYMPNSPIIRQVLTEILNSRGASLEDRIQLTHIGGLEWLANVLTQQGVSIATVLESKVATTREAEMDLKNFIPEYASKHLPQKEVSPWMPQFEQVQSEFLSQTISRVKHTG